MLLDGKVALVTGIESETGAAMARRFAAEGARVAACMGAGTRASSPHEVSPESVQTLAGDIRVPADAERIVASVLENYGRLDILVNYGAARRVVGTIMDITDEDFDEEMAADLKSVIVLSRAAVPAMEKGGGGAIVNISSIARAGVKGRALRSASKAALSSLTRAMALDHAAQGIRVNAVLAGPTLTADLQARPEQLRQLESEAPLRRLHTTDDVAAAVLFLASDESRSITGALLPLDAGRSLPSF